MPEKFKNYTSNDLMTSGITRDICTYISKMLSKPIILWRLVDMALTLSDSLKTQEDLIWPYRCEAADLQIGLVCQGFMWHIQ